MFVGPFKRCVHIALEHTVDAIAIYWQSMIMCQKVVKITIYDSVNLKSELMSIELLRGDDSKRQLLPTYSY